MSKPSFVYVLVEDSRQRQFIYRFLIRAGIQRHQLNIESAPSGHGSAEKWVSDNIATQASKCRARNARGNATGMFVMIDADKHSVQERLIALDESLLRLGKEPLGVTGDPIARLVPKRNIETWILCLGITNSRWPEIDEERDYKPTKSDEEWSELIPNAAEALYKLTVTDKKPPENLIDSLRRGIDEIPRALSAKV